MNLVINNNRSLDDKELERLHGSPTQPHPTGCKGFIASPNYTSLRPCSRNSPCSPLDSKALITNLNQRKRNRVGSRRRFFACCFFLACRSMLFIRSILISSCPYQIFIMFWNNSQTVQIPANKIPVSFPPPHSRPSKQTLWNKLAGR